MRFSREAQRRSRSRIDEILAENRRLGQMGTAVFQGIEHAVKFVGFGPNRSIAHIEYMVDGQIMKASCLFKEIVFDR